KDGMDGVFPSFVSRKAVSGIQFIFSRAKRKGARVRGPGAAFVAPFAESCPAPLRQAVAPDRLRAEAGFIVRRTPAPSAAPPSGSPLLHPSARPAVQAAAPPLRRLLSFPRHVRVKFAWG